MSEEDRDVVKYDMHRSFEIEDFEKIHEVLMLSLLQPLHLLVSIGLDEVLDNNELARRILSNGHNNEAIELELVDFLQAVLRRFVLRLHVLMRSDSGINDLEKNKFLRISSCLSHINPWGARSSSL